MAWHRPGDKPWSEPRMNSLLTYICVTRPQGVKYRGRCVFYSMEYLPIVYRASSVMVLIKFAWNIPAGSAFHSKSSTRPTHYILMIWHHYIHLTYINLCNILRCLQGVLLFRWHICIMTDKSQFHLSEMAINLISVHVLFTETIKFFLIVESERFWVCNIWDYSYTRPWNHLGWISLPNVLLFPLVCKTRN